MTSPRRGQYLDGGRRGKERTKRGKRREIKRRRRRGDTLEYYTDVVLHTGVYYYKITQPYRAVFTSSY